MKKPLVRLFIYVFLMIVLLFAVGPVFAQGESPPVVETPTKPADVYASFGFLVLAVRELVGITKQLWKDRPRQDEYDTLTSIVFGLLLASAFKINVFAAAGLETTEVWATWIAILATGYLMSKGSNLANDFLKAKKAEADIKTVEAETAKAVEAETAALVV